mmetsp:Transcript_11264/g.16458  ORF Transcript_11264/g.16458 Transcript_11264/m.16458 type:complete len:439 (-) Transcript_11264:2193-3509(-)
MGKNKSKQASKKRKLQQEKLSNASVEVSLDSALSSSRKKKSPNGEKIATVYRKDLGMRGIRSATVTTPGASSNSFKIKQTREEREKRKDRELRFAKTRQPAKSPIPGDDDGLPAALSMGLSASREAASESPRKKKKRKKGKQQGRIVGTCQSLEKQYLRLTDFPKPEEVRPEPVLRRALAHIKHRYNMDEDFDYANEQLKSVRQDVTVQGIRKDFVLDLYETHARILLENGDLNEFNQCQTMIATLTGVGGMAASGEEEDVSGEDVFASFEDDDDDKLLTQCEESDDEFSGYGILYALVVRSGAALTLAIKRGRRKFREEHHPQSMSTSKHALAVVKAVQQHDYRTFFRLYSSAPHMSAYLMDFLVKRVRLAAYHRVISSYRPTVSTEFFREVLAFKELDETRRYLKNRKAVFLKEKGEPRFWIDCKSCKCLEKEEET